MLRTLLFFAILIPGVFAAFRSRYAALLLYLWYAFFRPQDWIWLDISGLHLSLLLAILLVVPSLLTGILPNVTHPLSLGAIVFLLSGAIAQLGAVNADVGFYWLDYLTRLLLITLLATSLVNDRRRFVLAVMVVALSFGFHASKAGLSSLLSGGSRYFVGPGGAFSDNNAYGVAMAMIAPLLIFVAQNTTSRAMRWGCRVAVPLVVLGIVGTYSRGAFLALGAASITIILFQPRRWAWLTLVIALSLPIAFFMARQDGYLERMSTIRTYEADRETSAMSRPHFWRVAVDMALDRPLGIGLFNFETAYDHYDYSQGEYGFKRSVHSSHFQVLAENGFLGAMAWIFQFAYAIVLTLRIRRRGLASSDVELRQICVTASVAFLASIMAFLVGGAFIAMALNDLTWLTFALLASLDLISRPAPAWAAAPARANRAFSLPAYGRHRPVEGRR